MRYLFKHFKLYEVITVVINKRVIYCMDEA